MHKRPLRNKFWFCRSHADRLSTLMRLVWRRSRTQCTSTDVQSSTSRVLRTEDPRCCSPSSCFLEKWSSLSLLLVSTEACVKKQMEVKLMPHSLLIGISNLVSLEVESMSRNFPVTPIQLASQIFSIILFQFYGFSDAFNHLLLPKCGFQDHRCKSVLRFW